MASDGTRLYRVIFAESGNGKTIEVAFEDTNPDRAVSIAQKASGEGDVRIFADERLLGSIRRSESGFWVVS